MYAKTEIYYMMRDKVIPCLLNSERTIKYEDIKEVLEKSSYWKGKGLFNSNVKNGPISLKNKILNQNKTKKKHQFHSVKSRNTILSTDKEDLSRISLLTEILKINSHSNKSHNQKSRNTYKTLSNEPIKTFSTRKTEINFNNPILKSFSNKMYKLNESFPNKKIIPFKINKSKFENNILNKDKNNNIRFKNNFFFRNHNNTLKNLSTDYDYKIFYYLKNEERQFNVGNKKIQRDEKNNHLILRGLAINDEQKYIFTKCQLFNVEMEENKKNLKNIKEIISKSTNIKKGKKIKINKNRKYNFHHNYKFNLEYSLKSLLNNECPIHI